MMSSPPTGTVTFLFTDIEGSTKLAQEHSAEWETARARHHAILREAIAAHHGYVFQVIGDAFCVAFPTAPNALASALAAQRALQAEAWGQTPIHVRIGLHTGAAEARAGDYYGYVTLAHVQRVMSVAYGAQTLVSNATAGLLSGQLSKGVTLRDMGEHRLKGLLKPEHLWQAGVPDLLQDFPPLQSLNTIPNNLPIQVTSFVGREREIAEVKRLLSKSRLLTLTGSGGTGKTRLSLQVAAEVLDNFKDGVWFIELAPLADAALVPQTVANVLGVREEPGRPLMATLIDWLHTRQLLLILDNCEHLIDACARLGDAVLHAGHETQILASSREALGVAGESAYRVPSLECPNAAQANNSSTEQLTQYAAVQLFIERATQSLTAFTVTNANAPAVAQICYRLEGIPLAIELAAARVRGLSVEQIAARLDNSFQLLTGGSRTVLPRQQTLRALIDWSHNLLSEHERRLLRRLSVFAGGWTLEAAESVCAGRSIEPQEVLDLLLRLQDKSLVAMEERAGHARYRLLETVRQYARDKLMESDESEPVGDFHLAFFLRMAEEAEPKFESSERARSLAMLDEDLDNIRAAIRWAVARQPEAGLRLLGALSNYWWSQGHMHEGHQWAENALAVCDALPGPASGLPPDMKVEGAARLLQARAEAKALATVGFLAFLQGDYAGAQTRLEAAEVRAREANDHKIQRNALNYLGELKLYQGDYAMARMLHERSVRLARQTGDVWGLAYSLWFLGDTFATDDPAGARLAHEESLALFRQSGDRSFAAFPLTSLAHLMSQAGDYATARAWLEECLAIRREEANSILVTISLNSLAEVMFHQRDYIGAAALGEEGLALCRAVGNKSGTAWALRTLGDTATGQGDAQRARGLLQESLSLDRELGQKRDAVQVIESLANIAHTQGRHQPAVVLWGAADALRQSVDTGLMPNLRSVHDSNVAAARALLGDATFEAQFAEGHKLTFEQAIALALSNDAYGPIIRQL